VCYNCSSRNSRERWSARRINEGSVTHETLIDSDETRIVLFLKRAATCEKTRNANFAARTLGLISSRAGLINIADFLHFYHDYREISLKSTAESYPPVLSRLDPRSDGELSKSLHPDVISFLRTRSARYRSLGVIAEKFCAWDK